MKSTGIVRAVDGLGRIVIPKELRTTMDIGEKEALEYLYDESDKTIVLRKYQSRVCLFCGATENLNFFKDKFICGSCIREISRTSDTAKREVAVARQANTNQPARGVKGRRENSLERLLAVLQEHPYATQKELSNRLDLSQGRISQLIKVIKEKHSQK